MYTDEATYRSVQVSYVPALVVVNETGMVVHTTPAGSGAAVDEVLDRMTKIKEKAA